MIERTDSGSIVVLSLAHGPVNVMDTALLRHMTETFTALAAEQPAGVVLTGADYLAEFLPALSEALHTVFTFGRPVVAAVNGHAIAGGCVLACCADMRLMATGKGRIGVREFKVGVPFPRVPLEILVHAVGAKVAGRLVLSADTLTPPDALAVGLVDEVVEPGELLERAVAAATELATASPPDTFALTKAQLRRDTVERIARYRVDEDPEVARVWAAHQSDGWIAAYLASVTGKG